MHKNNKVQKLNRFENVCQLVIQFSTESRFGTAQGIKFSNDQYGNDVLEHIGNQKDEKCDLQMFQPLVFEQPHIYYQYYFNKESLPLFHQEEEQKKTFIQAVIYGIPQEYNNCIYLGQQLFDILYKKILNENALPPGTIERLTKIQQIISSWFFKISGPLKVQAQLSKILAINNYKLRNVLKIDRDYKVQDQYQLFGTTKTEFENTFTNIQQLADQEKDILNLKSSYIQDLIEYSVSVQTPLNKEEIKTKDFMKAIIKSKQMLEFLENNKELPQAIQKEVFEETSISNQWENLLYISNIPQKIKLQDLRKQLELLLKKYNARIFNPMIDIYIPEVNEMHQGVCLIFIDNWACLDLEEDNEKQLEEENEEEKQEEPVAVTHWDCPVCTFQNEVSQMSCEMCGAAQVLQELKKEEDKVQIETIDLNKNMQDIVNKNKERMENIINDFSDFINKTKLIKEKKEEKKKDLKQIKKIKKEQKEQKTEVQTEKTDQKLEESQMFELDNQEQQFLKGQQIMQNSIAKEVLQLALSSRVYKDNELTQQFQKFIKQYENEIFNQEVILMIFGNTNSIQNLQDIFQKELRQNNAINLFKYLHHFGFDFWLQQARFKDFSQTKLLDNKSLQSLLKYIQVELCKETKAVLAYQPNNIRILQHQEGLVIIEGQNVEAINFENQVEQLRSKFLQQYELREIRYSWAFLKLFNQQLAHTLPYINIPQYNDESTHNLTFSQLLSKHRNFIMSPLKIDLISRVMHKTTIFREQNPKITVERIKLSDSKSDFIFTKAYEQMKDVDINQFRPPKPSGSDPFICFEIIFKGELVMGESGPYRQFFADISSELQPNVISKESQSIINLLRPSKNNVNKTGSAQDLYVLNPMAKSHQDLNYFEFLGTIMACTMRSKATHLTLNLPQMFWKQIVGQEVELEDVKEIDEALYNQIKFFQTVNKEDFESSIFETFSVVEESTIKDLKENGRNIDVTYEDKDEYIQLLIENCLHSSQLQISQLKKGFDKLIPKPLLQIINAVDLSIAVCGKGEVDFEMLKRHTRYSEGLTDNSNIVKFLWETLFELNEKDSVRFIKFCWGQERLPANDDEFDRNQIRFYIKPQQKKHKNPDQVLPKADTCFFNLELPNYSSKAKLKEKLMIAIIFDCEGMNADNEQIDPHNSRYHNSHIHRKDSYDSMEDEE